MDENARDGLVALKLLLQSASESESQGRDDWFSVLRVVHQLALRRSDVGRCRTIEGWLLDHALHYRDASRLCSAWERKNERLLRQGQVREAYLSVNKLIKYSEKHGLVNRTVHDYLTIVQLYIVRRGAKNIERQGARTGAAIRSQVHINNQ